MFSIETKTVITDHTEHSAEKYNFAPSCAVARFISMKVSEDEHISTDFHSDSTTSEVLGNSTMLNKVSIQRNGNKNSKLLNATTSTNCTNNNYF
jgi:hypothetical protein